MGTSRCPVAPGLVKHLHPLPCPDRYGSRLPARFGCTLGSHRAARIRSRRSAPILLAMRQPWDRALGSRMTRTMWIALLCLVTSVASIAIRVATPPAGSLAQVAPDQSKIAMGPVPNESGKSDRLQLPDIRAETEVVPAAQAVPLETSSTEPEAIKIPGRRWRDANARIPPSEPPHRRNMTREPKTSAGSKPPHPRAELWHCRQDAVGSLLRSLDLSPRCDL